VTQGTILREGRVSKRRPPVNLRPEDAGLFSRELERAIPPTRLLELSGVWASADGFLFKGGRILVESFAFPANRASWKRRSVLKFLASNYLLRRRRRLPRPAAWIVDDWSYGYFHWLADALTRLYTIRHLLGGLVLLLPHRYAGLEFVRSSLEAFGVREVEYLRPGEVVRCERLLMPTPTAPSGHYNEEVIRSTRDVLVGAYRPVAGGGDERIYISRGGARKRRIVNEDAVVDALREFGFQVVHAEEHSLAEQVRMASAATCLVSNHGAGLTNMLFMPAGARVLELRHRADGVNNCHFALASALDLDFFYQACDPENRGEDAHTANLLVDVQALRGNLELMLGDRTAAPGT
jgi:capsular polysaccharide biosynthesis protein